MVISVSILGNGTIRLSDILSPRMFVWWLLYKLSTAVTSTLAYMKRQDSVANAGL